jgi:hypothetical protein
MRGGWGEPHPDSGEVPDGVDLRIALSLPKRCCWRILKCAHAHDTASPASRVILAQQLRSVNDKRPMDGRRFLFCTKNSCETPCFFRCTRYTLPMTMKKQVSGREVLWAGDSGSSEM